MIFSTIAECGLILIWVQSSAMMVLKPGMEAMVKSSIKDGRDTRMEFRLERQDEDPGNEQVKFMLLPRIGWKVVCLMEGAGGKSVGLENAYVPPV
jgi:hypothetical protein